MKEYSKNLKDDESVKLQLVKLVREDGLSIAQAANALDIAPRSAQLFFQAGTQWSKEWWNDFKVYDDVPKASPKKLIISDSTTIDPDKLASLNKTTVEENPFAYLKEAMKQHFKTGQALVEKKQPVQRKSNTKILVIADTQCKPTEDLDYMSWIGKYINDKRPDVIVHIGDHYDFPSLSSYDKGKRSFEGRRLIKDIEAGNLGMHLLTREFLSDDYKPRMVFCCGNHEERLDRLAETIPELDGYVGLEFLPLADMGWEVYPFLKPVEIEGIYFVHYLSNPMSGKPYGGSALNQLKTVGRSFVVGHKQCLDIAIRPTIDGKHQIGIVNGAAYPFDEGYKGYQGNNHFRGITMLHEAEDGFALPCFVSLKYLKETYND
jgi:hypothetical protein